jgi:hypothetical protein
MGGKEKKTKVNDGKDDYQGRIPLPWTTDFKPLFMILKKYSSSIKRTSTAQNESPVVNTYIL